MEDCIEKLLKSNLDVSFAFNGKEYIVAIFERDTFNECTKRGKTLIEAFYSALELTLKSTYPAFKLFEELKQNFNKNK